METTGKAANDIILLKHTFKSHVVNYSNPTLGAPAKVTTYHGLKTYNPIKN